MDEDNTGIPKLIVKSKCIQNISAPESTFSLFILCYSYMFKSDLDLNHLDIFYNNFSHRISLLKWSEWLVWLLIKHY